MNILLTAATTNEIRTVINHLDNIADHKSFLEYKVNGHSIFPLVTGPGAMNTAFALARFPKINSIQLAINAGLAGTYTRELNLGSVVEVVKDRFADLGSEDKDGSLLDVFDLALAKADDFPYARGWIHNKLRPYHTDLPEVSACTVNKTSGTTLSIALLREKYQAQIESMEGAGFFYACKIIDISCIQIRAISNIVESRNKTNWQLDLAIERLNQNLINFIHIITKERYV